MGASLKSGGSGGGRRRRRARAQPMADINVTPMVDVMLVLLIVFMVTAPLLTSGVAIDLPQTKSAELPAQNEVPLTITVDAKGKVTLGEDKVPLALDELVTKLMAISKVKKGFDERIFVRGDRAGNYGAVMEVMGRISSAGFKRVALVTESEKR